MSYPKCSHGKRKHHCRKCGGNQVCDHCVNRRFCRKCGINNLCKHLLQPASCARCGGINVIAKRLLSSAKCRAAKKKLQFNLSLNDILRMLKRRKCPVFGIKLKLTNSKSNCDSSPSLDRVIPKLGYVKGNAVVISWRANRIKSDANIGEITQLLRYMKRHV